jgi:hypothetical protein
MKKNLWTWIKEYFSHLKHSIKNSFLLGFLWKFLKMQLVFRLVSFLITFVTFLLFLFFNSNLFINKETFSLFLRNPLFIKTMITIEIFQLITTIIYSWFFYKSMAKFKLQPVSFGQAVVMLFWFPIVIRNNILGFIGNTLGLFNNSNSFNNQIKSTVTLSIDTIAKQNWIIKIVTLTNYLIQILFLILIYKLYQRLNKENQPLNSY